MNRMRTIFQSFGEFGRVEARFKGGGGSSTTQTSYVQSPEARQVMQAMMPAVQRVGAAGATGQALVDVPDLPQVSDAPMPTQGWFSNLDPNIMAGIREPYEQASQDLMEQMGAAGVGGSATAGLSGIGQKGLESFWSRAAPQMGMTAWNMINPNAMAQWTAEQQRAGKLQGQEFQARMAPYQIIPGMAGGSMPTPVTTQQRQSSSK